MNPVDYYAAAQERRKRDKLLRDAAPDLLAALEDASAYIEKCSYADRAKWLAVRGAVDAAIAKAKGEA